MKQGFFFLIQFFLLFGIVNEGRVEESSPPTSDSWNRIETLTTSAIRKDNFPSIVIGIVRNDSVRYIRGFGYADRDRKSAADGNTIYQIGSLTKTFTGNILAQLVMEGKLSLNDPVAKFFSKDLKFPAGPNGVAVTLKDLATHTAGFPRYPANLEREDGEPILGFSKQQLHRGIELIKMDVSPGGRYDYSNFGYGVLGTALENAAQKSLSELFSQRIFEPLKMRNSSLQLNEQIKRNLATPYRDDDPNVQTKPWDMGAMSGAGNIFSSVQDLSLFMMELLKDTEINRIQQKEYFKINETSSYGLGCFIIHSKEKNTRLIHHGGDIDGYASYLILYPEYKAGMVVLTNSGMGRRFAEVAEGLNKILFEELRKSGQQGNEKSI
jgi:CubicO group peptidase (beta-lactamase class C family)